MKNRHQRPAASRSTHYSRNGFLLSALLGGIILALGGCKFLMPVEIREITAKQERDAGDFERKHPGAFGDYTAEGRTIHFVEAGTKAAVPLVILIHGSPGDWRGWVEFLNDPELAARAHLIAVDRPGFGGSGAGRAELSLARQCRDIAPLINRVAPGQRVILVGHSFGGPIACRLAMEHANKVTNVIVLAGSIDPAQEETKWYQYVAEYWGVRSLLPAELVTANREIRALKDGLTEMLPRWPDIRQRVTVIQGEADTLVPPANADFAQHMMTNAQPLEIIRLPGMNHFLPWKQFALVKKEILRHLQ